MFDISLVSQFCSFPIIKEFASNFWYCAVEKRLVEEVRNNDVLIIVGETGSGKTTRKFLFFQL